MNIIQSKTESEIPVTYGGIEFKEIIYISPRVRLLLENPDALSMDLTVFRHGGNVNGEEAIPYVRLHSSKPKANQDE